jgi:hypothetical protein
MDRDTAYYSTDGVDGRNLGWADIKFAIRDWQKILILLGQICIVMPVVGFLVFTPVLVGSMGFAGVKANLVSLATLNSKDTQLSQFAISSVDVRHTLHSRLHRSGLYPKEFRSLQRAFTPHNRFSGRLVSRVLRLSLSEVDLLAHAATSGSLV